MQRAAWVPISAGVVGVSWLASRSKWFNTLHARATPQPPTDEPESTKVIELEPDNFKDLVQKQKNLFVALYAPWCPHCRNLFPILDDIAAQGSNQLNGVLVCKLDVDKHKDLGKPFKIRYFPMLVYMTPGEDGLYKVAEFRGDRDVAGISEWIREISNYMKHGYVYVRPPLRKNVLFPEKEGKPSK